MRLFLAINPPIEIRRRIWEATAPVREVAPDVTWVAEPRIHLTLKFLGEQPEEAMKPLTATVARIASDHSAPNLVIGGIGAFPNFRRPRVVWIGVTPEPRLELLHHDIEVGCSAIGHEVDGRPFRPHLTLARVPKLVPAEQLRGLKSAAGKVRFSDEFLGTSIEVMRSDPGPGGSTYTPLASAAVRSI